jgi:hypothetical protein
MEVCYQLTSSIEQHKDSLLPLFRFWCFFRPDVQSETVLTALRSICTSKVAQYTQGLRRETGKCRLDSCLLGAVTVLD